MILAGDIGGTHTRLAIFTGDPSGSPPLLLEVHPSRAYTGLTPIVSEFLSRNGIRATSACFGIAGPIRNQRCEASNLPWIVDARELAADLHVPVVILINDLEANAYGISLLQPSDLVILNSGIPIPGGNQALISAGTGLGEAGLVFEDGVFAPFPSEGGHVDFGPRTDLEIDLLRYLLGRFGHVSYERVLSGPGLRNIYDFLCETGRVTEPAWLTAELLEGDASHAISKHGMARTCDGCAQALDIFASIYGSEAGNLALKVMATGGVYVGGGIAPNILPKLQEPEFLRSFCSKGRMSSLLRDVPVRVIMNDMAALSGAASVAAHPRRHAPA